jgi:uncharacterized protein YuzE
MAKQVLENKLLSEVFQTTPHLIKFPSHRFWVDYDKEADVLYISLHHPQKATDSKMLDNGALLRYRDKKLVGITILDASKRN